MVPIGHGLIICIDKKSGMEIRLGSMKYFQENHTIANAT